MNLKVLGNTVLVLQHTIEKTVSGIIIPPSSQEQQVKIVAEVIATGPDVKGVIIRDMIIFPRHTGQWVTDPETNIKYVLLKEEDILAVIELEEDDIVE